MAFNEEECLHVARYLLGEQYGPCTKEASQRAAVSRAFIAAFVFVRSYEISNYGYRPKGDARDHLLLKQHLIRRGATTTMGDLQNLSIMRGYCDYDKIILGTENQKEQMVKDAVKLSEDIIKNIN
jgi:hypothetical protein